MMNQRAIDSARLPRLPGCLSDATPLLMVGKAVRKRLVYSDWLRVVQGGDLDMGTAMASALAHRREGP
jgi:hypothetical protein